MSRLLWAGVENKQMNASCANIKHTEVATPESFLREIYIIPCRICYAIACKSLLLQRNDVSYDCNHPGLLLCLDMTDAKRFIACFFPHPVLLKS
jgi:hypothetical protein